MSLWIGLVILAQFINAAIVLVDKYLLVTRGGVGKPAAYAFFVSVLSAVVIVMVPFGVISLPTSLGTLLSCAVAGTYIASIFFLYTALREMNASESVPIVGAVSALTAALLAGLWLTHDLPASLVPAFLLLTAGTFLVYCFCFSWRTLGMVILSGFLFGLSAFLTKLLFNEIGFVDGFFWSRMGSAALACALLIIPAVRSSVRESLRASSSGTKGLVVLNKVLAGVAFFLILLAINWGSVSLVNALAGLQLVFLFILSYLLARFLPHVESAGGGLRLALRLAGTLLIVAGLAALFLVS